MSGKNQPSSKSTIKSSASLKRISGDDTLIGGPANEHLSGGRGNDLIAGNAGNDGRHCFALPRTGFWPVLMVRRLWKASAACSAVSDSRVGGSISDESG